MDASSSVSSSGSGSGAGAGESTELRVNGLVAVTDSVALSHALSAVLDAQASTRDLCVEVDGSLVWGAKAGGTGSFGFNFSVPVIQNSLDNSNSGGAGAGWRRGLCT